MKYKLFLMLLTVLKLSVFSQNKLVMDLDQDGKNDIISIDSKKSTIVCMLSSMNNKKISSKKIDHLNFDSGLEKTKNGFLFYNNFMRAGYKNQFRYNPKSKSVQLIGMSRYEYGNAVGDGSGESSVNLLTNEYIGIWYYFDLSTNKLIKIPTIKSNMHFNETNLEDFSENTYFNYADRCNELYDKYRQIDLEKH